MFYSHCTYIHISKILKKNPTSAEKLNGCRSSEASISVFLYTHSTLRCSKNNKRFEIKKSRGKRGNLWIYAIWAADSITSSTQHIDVTQMQMHSNANSSHPFSALNRQKNYIYIKFLIVQKFAYFL